MADTYEAYDVYIRTKKSDEFSKLINDRFGDAVELNWRDSIDKDDAYDAYVDSDRADEFQTVLDETFGAKIELNWRETLDV